MKSSIVGSKGQTCVDCGASAPATETNYTLISPRHGWRLAREILRDGKKVARWRCPFCWEKFKGRGG